MQPLEKSLRNKLEKTIRDARDIAETAAKAVLEQLGVGEAAPFGHFSKEEKTLRLKLRVHGRQLGDTLNGGKVHTMDRLIEEVAYEHWHRMLFARFLAENNLLMYPDPENPVAVSLEECEDLAVDEGAKNGWELAARFAARMLPQIFRPDSPVFQLQFAANHQLPLEKLLADLPQEVFTASDSLGWVYQFWQAKRKDEVNASEVKIGAWELPAVTQLFTESYMVAFLLDNSLGAWWVAKVAGLKDGKELRLGAREILQTAETEEELRVFFSLSGVPLEYLRFVKTEISPIPSLPKRGTETESVSDFPTLEKGGEGGFSWLPAAGTFDGWPKSLRELKTLDPCCGSGHFLVAAFLMLVAMRMELEGLSAREAVDAVLRENIHGLEIDKRCVELAAFALALTAWRYPFAGGYRPLPELNVACSGLAISARKEKWVALAGDNNNLRMALEEIYKQFKDAPVLGSLINPDISLGKGSLYELKWEEAGPLLAKALAGEKNDERSEMGVVVLGLSKAAQVLVNDYTWVITNVPFLGRHKQNKELQAFSDAFYPQSKGDLSTSMIERCLAFCKEKAGTFALVSPQNWLFKGSTRALRERFLKESEWNLIGRLGASAFKTPMWNFNISLLVVSNRIAVGDAKFGGIDVSNCKTPDEKSYSLTRFQIHQSAQAEQTKNPDSRILIGSKRSDISRLSRISDSYQGLRTGDLSRFIHYVWELNEYTPHWEPIRSSTKSSIPHEGCQSVIFWENGCGTLASYAKTIRDQLHDMHKSGNKAWGHKGVTVNYIGAGPALYGGEKLDANVCVITPNDESHLPALWCFCSSDEYLPLLRELDQRLSITNQTLLKVPFDLDHWTKIAQEKYPNGLPNPYTDDPTQWIFHGHPCGSVVWDEDKKWTSHGQLRTDDTVLQVAVARLLGYRWPAELDCTMELSDETRAWVKKSKDLLSFADEDGIVCIPPVRGESSAADRLLNLLAAAYGNAWSNDKLSELLNHADHAGKTLETWLRDKFFAQHCKRFQHRPFIWHIWDGLRDGFAALVNYHKLDHKNLETLIYTYLGDCISRQKDDIRNSVDGAAEKLAAAEQLKKKLELILEGEAPYDIFVRWKPLEKQPIGWTPDLNDGVRLNIRPFMTAGVLRFNKKPQINITWDKDRGKDVESAPWYKMFKGDRINDHHLSLEVKKATLEGKDT